MDTSITSIPPDLWPQAPAAKSSRPRGDMLALEIPSLTEALLLGVLARAIHLEMRGAGEWFARIDIPADRSVPSAQEFSRFRADNAARLLALYTALFLSGQYAGSSDPTPEALKAAASKSYQFACRDELAKTKRANGYNDSAYQTEKAAAVTPFFPSALIATP